MRVLRCVYNKRVAPHGDDDFGLTLFNRRLQDIAILIFKAVNGILPRYISDLFVVRNNVKCMRSTNKLSPSSLGESHKQCNMVLNYKGLYGIFYKISMEVVKSENSQ